MLQLKLIIMLVCLRSETNLLNINLNLLLFHFLSTFLLLIQELAIVDDTTNWRLSIGGYFHKVNALFTGHI